MSSRNSFTTSYIYHEEAVEFLAEKLAPMGYGVQAVGEQDKTQVVGMIKNVEFSADREDKIREALTITKNKFDIEYPISIVFIGDTWRIVNFYSTAGANSFRTSILSDLEVR